MSIREIPTQELIKALRLRLDAEEYINNKRQLDVLQWDIEVLAQDSRVKDVQHG